MDDEQRKADEFRRQKAEGNAYFEPYYPKLFTQAAEIGWDGRARVLVPPSAPEFVIGGRILGFPIEPSRDVSEPTIRPYDISAEPA
jgi:hypothetical protein